MGYTLPHPDRDEFHPVDHRKRLIPRPAPDGTAYNRSIVCDHPYHLCSPPPRTGCSRTRPARTVVWIICLCRILYYIGLASGEGWNCNFVFLLYFGCTCHPG